MNDAPPQKRRPWYLVTGLVVGLVLGLTYAWKISPVRYVDTEPSALRADFKDEYRLTIALAYLNTGNLERARARLALLGETDPAAALTGQAQRRVAQGDPDGESRALLALATALSRPAPLETTPVAEAPSAEAERTPSSPTPPTATPVSGLPRATRTPTSTRLVTPPASPTPRPTRTPTPTAGLPFRLVGHTTVCDATLPEGLLQIEVRDRRGRPLAGVEMVITWQGGEEHIFTGLKPELGDGYADYQMTPGLLYTLQLMPASTLVTDLSAPRCNDQGQEYWGSLRLSFEQP